MTRCTLLTLLLCSASVVADLTKLDRRIAKEPAYTSKTPRYALLVLGPDTRDRVWLVKDGSTLYVDRNGNGDLTEAGEKILGQSRQPDQGNEFKVDDFQPGGANRCTLSVFITPVKHWMFDDHAKRADMQAAMKKDPLADTLRLRLETTMPHIKRKGQVTYTVGPIDLEGPLCLGASPAEAPIIHFGGPLEVTFYSSRPTLRRNRGNELMLVVGSRGQGPGTFAMLNYDGTIPLTAHPMGEMTFPSPKPGGDPIKKRFEVKERC